MTREEKLSLLQGRKQSPWLPTLSDTLYIAAVCGAIVLLILMFGGCAEVPRVYVENGVTFHEGSTEPCERGASACTINMRDVYYAKGDMLSLSHEREHLAGMRHGPWSAYGYDNCAKVLAAGTTKWHVGALLCRRSDGFFYERAM